MSDRTLPCYPLEWDSQFFGFKIAKVTDPLLTEERCRQIDAQCRAEGVRCLYFRASSDDPATTRLAEDNGFHLVDVKTTLYRKLDERFRPRTIASRIREASEADLPVLERIAAASHRNTRFFYDGRFNSNGTWSASEFGFFGAIASLTAYGYCWPAS